MGPRGHSCFRSSVHVPLSSHPRRGLRREALRSKANRSTDRWQALREPHPVRDPRTLGTSPCVHRESQAGTFGAKLMWNNLRWALARFQEIPRFGGLDPTAVFHAAFPNLHVVHVTRRDHVRQAVSWARMAQDGVWVVSDEEPARPRASPQYNFDLINRLEGLIVESESGSSAVRRARLDPFRGGL